MRKEQQQVVRDIAPKVELIQKPKDTDHLTLEEFIDSMEEEDFVEKVAEATGISVEMLSSFEEWELVEFFETADVDDGGTMEFAEFAEAITMLKQANDDFAKLFTIVDNLLGNQSSKFMNHSPNQMPMSCTRRSGLTHITLQRQKGGSSSP